MKCLGSVFLLAFLFISCSKSRFEKTTPGILNVERPNDLLPGPERVRTLTEVLLKESLERFSESVLNTKEIREISVENAANHMVQFKAGDVGVIASVLSKEDSAMGSEIEIGETSNLKNIKSRKTTQDYIVRYECLDLPCTKSLTEVIKLGEEGILGVAFAKAKLKVQDLKLSIPEDKGLKKFANKLKNETALIVLTSSELYASNSIYNIELLNKKNEKLYQFWGDTQIETGSNLEILAQSKKFESLRGVKLESLGLHDVTFKLMINKENSVPNETKYILLTLTQMDGTILDRDDSKDEK